MTRTPEYDPSLARRAMVDTQLRQRGIRDERVLKAMSELPRERFVPREVRSEAYEDRALPIGLGQTISQPYIVAFMTEQLRVLPECTVLEIGTGSGYQAAVLASLAKRVVTIERIAALQVGARTVLAELGLENITFVTCDGTLGFPEYAPYDRIVVTAGAPRVPPRLVEQLSEDGTLILPVGASSEQTLVRVQRLGDRTAESPLLACRFVRLIGQEGWCEP